MYRHEHDNPGATIGTLTWKARALAMRLLQGISHQHPMSSIQATTTPRPQVQPRRTRSVAARPAPASHPGPERGTDGSIFDTTAGMARTPPVPASAPAQVFIASLISADFMRPRHSCLREMSLTRTVPWSSARMAQCSPPRWDPAV